MKKILSRCAIFSLWCCCMLLSCNGPANTNPHVTIQTSYGDIEVELLPLQAPKSVAAFLSYIDSGYYKNSSFYRALNEENQPSGSGETALVQGGVWKTKNHPNVAGIPHETTQQTGITHKNGTVSLARQAPGSGGTEFFICVGDQAGFDFGGDNNPDGQGYAAFGRVVKGMDIVKKIQSQPVSGESLVTKVEITNINRL